MREEPFLWVLIRLRNNYLYWDDVRRFLSLIKACNKRIYRGVFVSSWYVCTTPPPVRCRI